MVDRQAYNSLSPIVHKWKTNLDDLGVVNSYGLFRSMTGVGGRPEVIVEGSNNADAGWQVSNLQASAIGRHNSEHSD